MSGLLDMIKGFEFNPSPFTMGLMQAGANMMQAGGPSRMPVNFGQVLGAGMGGLLSGSIDQKRYMDELEAQRQQQLYEQQRMEAARATLAAQQEKYRREQEQQDILKTIDLNSPDAFNKLLQAGNISGAIALKNQQAIAERPAQDQFLNTQLGYMSVNPKTKQITPLEFGGQQLMNAPMDPILQAELAYRKSLGTQNARIGNVTLPGGEQVPMRLGDAVTGYSQGDLLLGQSTVAKKGAEVLGKAQIEAKMDLPKAEAEATYANELLESLKNHPGLSGVVGVPNVQGALNIPGTKETDFRTRLDQIKGQQFMQAYKTLKGGGQITEIEGEKATQAQARLGTAQTEEAFKEAIDELQGIIQKGMERAKAQAENPLLPPGPPLRANVPVNPGPPLRANVPERPPNATDEEWGQYLNYLRSKGALK